RPWTVFLGTLAVKELWMLLHPLPPALRRSFLAWFTSHPEVFFYTCGFWIVATVLHPRSWTTRFLEVKVLRYVGRLSYSLYLWHILFFITSDPVTRVTNPALLFLASRPSRYLATAAVALLSYYWIEKPLIRLGHRLAPPATPGHADLDTTTTVQTPTLAGGQ
ncbi:MAG TPA: hypothetical protein VKV02_10715, partial [Acidobacteriaceae bacterium]|nr:hypothetical protein [Acidobacteriaceae bacterium]